MTTVNQGVVEIAAKAADRHPICVAALAGALDRHAWNSLHRGRDVRIGELADVFGGDRIHYTRSITLGVQIALKRSANAGDDNWLRSIGLVRCLLFSWRNLRGLGIWLRSGGRGHRRVRSRLAGLGLRVGRTGRR